MASPSSVTRAAISSREIKMRPMRRSTVVSARLAFGSTSPSTGGALLGRDEGGQRTLRAEPLGGRGRLLPGPIGADPHAVAGHPFLRGQGDHVRVQRGAGQLLPQVVGLAAVPVGADLDWGPDRPDSRGP